MKKSIFAAVTSPGSRSKLEARNTIHAAGDSSKISKEKPCKSTSSVTSRPSTSEAALVTTILHNSATGLDDKLKLAQKVPDMDKYGGTDESASGNSSEEDSEFDEEVLRKLLKRKIEQAPAAKVIVSDAMMREALSEMSARKSSISTTAKSSAQSMLSKGGGGGDQRVRTVSSVLTTDKLTRKTNACVVQRTKRKGRGMLIYRIKALVPTLRPHPA